MAIKASTIEGIRRYADMHCRTGSFLEAVLCNDLKEACMRADDENRENLFEIVEYCWCNIPHSCWGSPERVKAWLEGKIIEEQRERERERVTIESEGVYPCD
jgi:hypothetical protein